MPSVYLCDMIGTGTRLDPQRASLPTSQGYAVLMIDTVNGKAIALAVESGIVDPSVTELVSGGTRASLRTNAQATGPNGTQRARFNTWLTNAGYPTIPAGLTTWWDIIHAAARVVNPGVDIDQIVVT